MERKSHCFTIGLVLLFQLLWMGGCSQNRLSDEMLPESASASSASTQPAADQSCGPVCVADEACVLDADRHPLTRQFDRQIHNAELADMAVTDIHFLPNRPGLNATGTQRLCHLAWLANRYGGCITVDLGEPGTDLAKQRVKTVADYLREYGLPASKVRVSPGLPQGKGMDAPEAITVYRETRFQPKQDQQRPSRISRP